MGRPSVAIVGCGAVTEKAHLPALRTLGVTPALLVDRDLERARRLADEFGVPRTGDDYREVIDGADAAIVALPNQLHAPVTRELLHAGVHVLVEKPMARTYEECMSMIEASESSGATLMVGLRRRFVFASQWMKRTVASGALGTIQTFDFAEGRVFDWPTVSDSFWRREQAGGGVLIDIGPHVLDQLMWWLGPVKTVRYADDARGGVEGECELELELESGARGRVELSRMRFLRGSAIIVGSRGQVEIALDGNWAERRLPGSRRLPLFPRQSWDDVFPVELRNWLDTVVGGAPAVSARDAAATAQLIDTCYAQRSPLTLPWRDLVPGAVSGGQP